MNEAQDDDGVLDELDRAFEAGNYAAVRSGVTQLLANGDERTKKRARLLHEKTQPDPNIKWLFLIALVVVLAVTVYWGWRS
jgi:hypothetical protein